MGRILQIRVSAWTYDEADMARAWPHLTELVWPAVDTWSPPGGKHGVMELVAALPDVTRFADMPQSLRSLLNDAMPALTGRADDLNKALADWEPRLANIMSERLEDSLGALEQALKAEKETLASRQQGTSDNANPAQTPKKGESKRKSWWPFAR